jgi:hypothetical protein
MKQVEFEKILNTALKREVNLLDWKFSRGFAFKKQGDLFFTVLITGQPKNKTLICSLQFKHYNLDDVFWEIVKLPENKKQPISFRACGAWVVPSMQIFEEKITLSDCNEDAINGAVGNILRLFDQSSSEIASTIFSHQTYLKTLEKTHLQHLKHYPNTARTIWMEQLLIHLLESRFVAAMNIASARIVANDSGGFYFEGKSFFQLAEEYIQRLSADR